MKMQSITRRLIAVVLLLELLCGLALIGIMVLYESNIHLRAFDVMLSGRAYALFGAVEDAEDAADSVVLDLNSVAVPPRDFFRVDEEGQLLGQSPRWPEQEVRNGLQRVNPHGIFRTSIDGRSYRFIVFRGVRVIDPREKNGGVAHRIRVIYGAPVGPVWHQVLNTVRFLAIATLLLLAATGGAMAWFLRRGLAPLKELAEEASRISAQQWSFHPPESARYTQELAPLASALEAALGRLQEAFSQQRRFTSNAAHELKTDIAIAKSSLQLLSMKPRSAEEYQQGLDVCLADCLRLEETVQRMLMLARAESASSAAGNKTEAQNSDLAACARESARQLTSLVELSRVNVIFEASNETPVPLDVNDCTVLCSNLLHNAIIHSAPGSIVNLAISTSDGWVTLTVQDYGDGISPEALPHVFEPFYRGDPSRDRRSGSTGLGLAICRALCQAAGGSISLTSELHAGTLVTVRLPIAVRPSITQSEATFSLA
jgi:signal transduction histidine kinase